MICEVRRPETGDERYACTYEGDCLKWRINKYFYFLSHLLLKHYNTSSCSYSQVKIMLILIIQKSVRQTQLWVALFHFKVLLVLFILLFLNIENYKYVAFSVAIDIAELMDEKDTKMIYCQFFAFLRIVYFFPSFVLPKYPEIELFKWIYISYAKDKNYVHP